MAWAWRRRKHGSPKQIGKPFPVKPPKKTIFFPAKYKKYSDIVSIKDPESARESVEKLWEEFNKAHTREKKVRIWHVTSLAAKRANAAVKKKGLSRKEVQEFKEVAKIYEEAAEKMHSILYSRD